MKQAKLLAELMVLSDSACAYATKSGFDLAKKVLFLISEYDTASPKLLLSKLNIQKSNLAIICKSLEAQKFIQSVSVLQDKRQIAYRITEKGQNELNKQLKDLSIFLREDEVSDQIIQSFEAACAFLNKKI